MKQKTIKHGEEDQKAQGKGPGKAGVSSEVQSRADELLSELDEALEESEEQLQAERRTTGPCSC